MKIEDVKICGISDSVGYDLDALRVTFALSGQGGTPDTVLIEVSDRTPFRPLYRQDFPYGLPSYVLAYLPSPATRYRLRITVRCKDGVTVSDHDHFFETPPASLAAGWIGTAPGHTFPPVFSRAFSLRGKVASARLYVCGVGLFEAAVNSRRVGDEYLTPYPRTADESRRYCTFDVSDLLREENEITVALGDGWEIGRYGLEGRRHVGSDRYALFCELRVRMADGRTVSIGSDETWEYAACAVTQSGIYDGETLDCAVPREPRFPAVPTDGAAPLPRIDLPVRITEELPVRALLRSPDGDPILDFGQNFAGFVRFSCREKRGTVITLEHAEILQDGDVCLSNLRTATGRFTYIADGKAQTVQPHFTYFGFRYVRVRGIEDLRQSDFTGCVLHTDLTPCGDFACGDGMLTAWYRNTVRAARSNFVAIPTDCPQRDERLGWTADAYLFAPAALFHFDCRAFYERYLRALRAAQEKVGFVPNYIPDADEKVYCSAGWGDAAVILPQLLYEATGERRVLMRHYPLMRDWVRQVRSMWVEGVGIPDSFGDWLASDGYAPDSPEGGTDKYLISLLYAVSGAQTAADTARMLGITGDPEEFSALAAHYLTLLLDRYFTPTGHLACGTQTALTLCLHFGIYRDRQILADQLYERLRADRYTVKCGFLGAPHLCDVLMENGMADIAYRLLLRREYPSWLYAVGMGATTTWERWNSVLPDGNLNPNGMNSLNHYAYGAAAHTLFRHVLGLQPTLPGWSEVRISPAITPRLHRAQGSYRSVRGLYGVRWEIGKNEVEVRVQIPSGCRAILAFPSDPEGERYLGGGNYVFRYRPTDDLLCPFNSRSTLREMARDPRAAEILRRSLPLALALGQSENDEDAQITFDELRERFYLPLDPEDITEAEKDILALRYEDGKTRQQ